MAVNSKFLCLFVAAFILSCDDKSKSSFLNAAPTSHEGHHHDSVESYFTCSMHPEVKSDKPGKCPICYMNLTQVEVERDSLRKEGEFSKSSEGQTTSLSNHGKSQPTWACKDFPDVTSEKKDVCPIDGTPMVKEAVNGPSPGKSVAAIKLKKSQLSHFKPSLFPVSTMKMTKKIRLLGDVTPSEEKESALPARVSGRVEKVFVQSTGTLIQKGDPVLALYSPELITAGEEYILARKNASRESTDDFTRLVRQSEEKLRLLGIPPFQFKSWYSAGKVPREIKIYSEVTGVVRKRSATTGKYFKAGQNFFELSDLSTVWVEMDVYEHDAGLVKIGQLATLEFTALPGQTIRSQIDFISPVVDRKSRTLKIRTTIENRDGKLMPGMVADATIHVEYPGAPLVIPRSSVIDTGKRKVVWQQLEERRYRAILIRSGLESEGYVEIVEGLSEGDLIVTDGNFLLDAQAQLFGGYEDFEKTPPN